MARRGVESRGREGDRTDASGHSCKGPRGAGSRDGRGRRKVHGGVAWGSHRWERGHEEANVRSGRGRRSSHGAEGSGRGSHVGSSLWVGHGGRSRRRDMDDGLGNGSGRGHGGHLVGSV